VWSQTEFAGPDGALIQRGWVQAAVRTRSNGFRWSPFPVVPEPPVLLRRQDAQLPARPPPGAPQLGWIRRVQSA
jgi:hypothetical protein